MSDMDTTDGSTAEPAAELDTTARLTSVRAELETIEGLRREVAAREAELCALLAPDHFQLVWAFRDAEERLGLAERLMATRWLVERLARCLPDHAATIRAEAQRVLEGPAAPEPA